MRKYLLLILFGCGLHAQPELLWHTAYPDDDSDYDVGQALSVIDVSDSASSGFLVSGSAGWSAGVLTKFDDTNETPYIEWANIYSDNGESGFNETIRAENSQNISVGS